MADFEKSEPVPIAITTTKAAKPAIETAERIVNLDDNEYTAKLPPWAKRVIIYGRDPEDSTRVYASRSEAAWAVANECVRCGVPDSIIASLFTDSEHKISESILEKKIRYLCETGRLPCQRDGHANAVRTDGDRARGEGFWNWVRREFPDLKGKGSEKLAAELRRWNCRIWESGQRGGYTFPTLPALRAAFEKIHGSQQWPPERTEWGADLPGADGPLLQGGDDVPF